ncbi:MAG: HI1506-related protein, partial [Kangiella sp.]|nr:HI1506-related protein [Kangiella sp.]
QEDQAKADQEDQAKADQEDQAKAQHDHNDDDVVKIFHVRSKKARGFRRCGFRFNKEGFGIAEDMLTEEQQEILINEPNLVVRVDEMTRKELDELTDEAYEKGLLHGID